MTVDNRPATINGAIRGRAISMVVHSETKTGKTTLGATAPKPMLLLDAEAAYRFLPIPPERRRFWDPLSEPPPWADGTWDVCIVQIFDYSVMTRAVDYLLTGQHHFKSVVVDSISEVQDKCKKLIKSGSDEMDQRKWGALLDHMADLVRQMRDLTEHPTTPLECVFLTAMTEQRDGKWRPYVQGALRRTMPYFLDVIGYLFVTTVPNPADPSQAGTQVRRMLVTPHPQFEAGERVQGRLGEFVDSPDLEQVLTSIFGPRPTQ